MKKSFFSKLLAVAAMASLLIATGCSADSSGGGDSSSEPDTASSTVKVSSVTISGSSKIGENGGSYTAVAKGENLDGATVTYKWEVSSGSSYVYFADKSANPAVLKVDSQTSEAQAVKIKVTASCGDSSASSDEFSVTLAAKGETVNDGITAVSASASSLSADSGASVTLTAAASANGNPEISYSWEITDGESYGSLSSDSGESVTLTLKNSTSSSQKVTVKVSASDGTNTKEDSVTVTVNAASSGGSDEDTTEKGSVSVTVNVDGTVTCAKCGRTYYFKSQAENCEHYKCETCGSVYYSESELQACASHVTVIFKDSDENGNETVEKVIKSGAKVEAPSWTKDGYKLTWESNVEGLTTDSAITSNVTFIASWTEKPKCSNCGTHYDTEEDVEKCSVKNGCKGFVAVNAGEYNLSTKGKLFKSQSAGATQTVSGITVTCKIDSAGANLKTNGGEVSFAIASAMTLKFTDSNKKGVIISTSDGYIGAEGTTTSEKLGADGAEVSVILGAGSYSIAGATSSSAKIATLTFAAIE